MTKDYFKTYLPPEIEKELTPEFLTLFLNEYLSIVKYGKQVMDKYGLDIGTVGFDKAFTSACKKSGNKIVTDFYKGDSCDDLDCFGSDVEILMRKYGVLEPLTDKEKWYIDNLEKLHEIDLVYEREYNQTWRIGSDEKSGCYWFLWATKGLDKFLKADHKTQRKFLDDNKEFFISIREFWEQSILSKAEIEKSIREKVVRRALNENK